MEVILHIGAHYTDGGTLLRSLLKNGDLLMRHGVHVPGPSRYRKTIGGLANRLRGNQPGPEALAALFDTIIDGDEPSRVILSNDSFMCLPERILDDGRLYARAFKTSWLRNLFPGHDIIFAVGMRNPAILLNALWHDMRLQGKTYEDTIGAHDPMTLRWSDVIGRIRHHNPLCPVVAWCHEDTPLVWPEILHLLTGIPLAEKLDGEEDMLAQIMQRAGMITFKETLVERGRVSTRERRDLALDLLETYAAPDQIDVEIDLPGWTSDLVERISDAYDADLRQIAGMEGVILVEP